MKGASDYNMNYTVTVKSKDGVSPSTVVSLTGNTKIEEIYAKTGVSPADFEVALIDLSRPAHDSTLSEVFGHNTSPTVLMIPKNGPLPRTGEKPVIDIGSLLNGVDSFLKNLNNLPQEVAKQRATEGTVKGVDAQHYFASAAQNSLGKVVASTGPQMHTFSSPISLNGQVSSVSRTVADRALTTLTDLGALPAAAPLNTVEQLLSAVASSSAALSSFLSNKTGPTLDARKALDAAVALHAAAAVQQEAAAVLLSALQASSASGTPPGQHSSTSHAEHSSQPAPPNLKEIGGALGQLIGETTGGGIENLLGGLFKNLNAAAAQAAPFKSSVVVEEVEDDDDDLYADACEAHEEEAEEQPSAGARQPASVPAPEPVPLASSSVPPSVRATLDKWTSDPRKFSQEVIATARNTAPFSDTYVAGAPSSGGPGGLMGGSGGQSGADNRLPAPEELLQLRWLRTVSNTKVNQGVAAPKGELQKLYVAAVLEKAARTASGRMDWEAVTERFPNLKRAVDLFKQQ